MDLSQLSLITAIHFTCIGVLILQLTCIFQQKNTQRSSQNVKCTICERSKRERVRPMHHVHSDSLQQCGWRLQANIVMQLRGQRSMSLQHKLSQYLKQNFPSSKILLTYNNSNPYQTCLTTTFTTCKPPGCSMTLKHEQRCHLVTKFYNGKWDPVKTSKACFTFYVDNEKCSVSKIEWQINGLTVMALVKL